MSAAVPSHTSRMGSWGLPSGSDAEKRDINILMLIPLTCTLKQLHYLVSPEEVHAFPEVPESYLLHTGAVKDVAIVQ